jgi:hypothetical protein
MVTGLTPNTEYRVMVVEYSGAAGHEVYVTSSATGNPANFTTVISAIDPEIKESITVYPNPFDDYIMINGSGLHAGSIASFYSLDGRLRYRAVLNHSTERINTSDIKAGAYILQLIDGDRNYSVKIVK